MLIDVDNFDELRDVDDASAFASTLMVLVRKFIAGCHQEVDQITVRLYGGWYEGAALTSRASALAQVAALGDPFPFRYGDRMVAGTLELARGPIHAPGLVLPHTHRIRDTAPRLRRTPGFADPSCCNDARCSAKRLERWSRGPGKICPTEGCSVTFKDAFFGREQKMVDTMLAIDLVDLALSQRVGAVAIVSDDTDFVPALVYAGHRGSGQVIMLRKGSLDSMLAAILHNAGVNPIGMV